MGRDPMGAFKQKAMQIVGYWLTAALGLRAALWLARPILPYLLISAAIAALVWLWRWWRGWR